MCGTTGVIPKSSIRKSPTGCWAFLCLINYCVMQVADNLNDLPDGKHNRLYDQ